VQSIPSRGGAGEMTDREIALESVIRRLAIDSPLNSEQFEKLRWLIKEIARAIWEIESRQAKQRMTPEGTEKERVTKRDILQSAPRLLALLDLSRQLDDGTFSLSPNERDELFSYVACTMPGTSKKKRGRRPLSPNAKLINWIQFDCEVKKERERLGARGTQAAALRAIAMRTLNGREMTDPDAVEKKVDALRKQLKKGPKLADAAPKLAGVLLGPSRKRFSGT
jgi:hypothetical protein